MVLGNVATPALPSAFSPGLAMAQRQLLRAGIIAYGFRLDVHDLGAVGSNALLLAVLVVASTLVIGTWIGRRWLGLDRDTALLTAAGSAICGAAAVLAVERALRADPGKVAMAVATVVLFGTLSLLLYPMLQPLLALSPRAFGIYTGATVHEVAQVVAIGQALGPEVADSAVVVKLARVLMLVPVLVIVSRLDSNQATGAGRAFPWFVLGFAAVVILNSLLPLPPAFTAAMHWLCTLLLATAMAALGLNTRFARLRALGSKPLVLALLLFVWLTVGGYVMVRLLA
jgi:uncharacterized integral membrane protein (TIGR00698 family)